MEFQPRGQSETMLQTRRCFSPFHMGVINPCLLYPNGAKLGFEQAYSGHGGGKFIEDLGLLL